VLSLNPIRRCLMLTTILLTLLATPPALYAGSGLKLTEPNQDLATADKARIIPIAGRTLGSGGTEYVTSLILHTTGGPQLLLIGPIYRGRIFFRPLGTTASDGDPNIAYAFHPGADTLVFDDILQSLGVAGVGTIEVRPDRGFPAPRAAAIIETRLPGGTRVRERMQATVARDHLFEHQASDVASVAIRNPADTLLTIGARTFGRGGWIVFERFASDGSLLGAAFREIGNDMTSAWSLQEMFNVMLPGDHIVGTYTSNHGSGNDGVGRGMLWFLLETGKDLNDPNVTVLESSTTDARR
jgi:hypothetical protein